MRILPYKEDGQAERQDGTRVEHAPYWAMNLMQNLARYVFESGKWFEPYHFFPANSPIRMETDIKLVGLAFVPDVRLETIDSPHGSVQCLQMVGVTRKELDWLWENPKTYRVKELVDKMREANSMLLLDLKREKDYVD
ncbi:suppressor of fused domain protein [Streptococcus ovuberis]|uniref:suppressor of fused domain protein n=1 Tax=Streptococcus ovuberis TaxID=1936207 RepID=UPI001B351C4C|nr:suppressor of fused domain protein [Streptococcus ovuberis]